MIRSRILIALFGISVLAPLAAGQGVAPPAVPSPPAAPTAPEHPSAVAPETAPAAKPAPRPPIYDETADAKALVAAALARAGRDNRRVLIQWGANWCGWCHLLHELCVSDKELSKELLYEYDVVLVDIGQWDKAMDLAAAYGADLRGTGVPYLTVLAADGSVLANQATDVLETRGDVKPGHDPAKVLAFLKEHQAPYSSAADLYRDALAAAGTQGKRVFLHFSAPWCGWCHKLEAWMAQPRIAELLGRDFIDCKIDVDRTVGGQAMLVAHRGSEQGGIPWFQFVAADGSVLVDSDGPDGNTGFPAAPGEIAHFGAMLKAAAVHLTAAEIDELLASLVPAPIPAAPSAGAPAGAARGH